jgi:hypothetical protein
MSAYAQQETEVRARMDAYLTAFASMSVEQTSSFYHVPGFLLGPSFTLLVGSHDQLRGFLEQTFGQMRADDFAGTRFGENHVFVLHPSAAVVSAVWERLGRAGEVLGRSAVTYQLTKSAGTWTIISGIMHDPTTTIRAGHPAAS